MKEAAQGASRPLTVQGSPRRNSSSENQGRADRVMLGKDGSWSLKARYGCNYYPVWGKLREMEENTRYAKQ